MQGCIVRGGVPPPPPGHPAYAQPLSPWRQVPASTAFVTDSNRQPLWQPPPTACPTASGAASEVPSLLMHPWGHSTGMNNCMWSPLRQENDCWAFSLVQSVKYLGDVSSDAAYASPLAEAQRRALWRAFTLLNTWVWPTVLPAAGACFPSEITVRSRQIVFNNCDSPGGHTAEHCLRTRAVGLSVASSEGLNVPGRLRLHINCFSGCLGRGHGGHAPQSRAKPSAKTLQSHLPTHRASGPGDQTTCQNTPH